MFIESELKEAYDRNVDFLDFIYNNLNGLDSLCIRKTGYDENDEFTNEEKQQVINYLKTILTKADEIYKILKDFIDDSEYRSDYYRCCDQKKFRGANSITVLKTFAAMILIDFGQRQSICQNQMDEHLK